MAEMSASDVALMAKDHDGWGDGMGFMWIFALLILAGGGFNGWGGNNAFQNAIGYENLATSAEVQRGFDNQNSMANEREILAAINGNALQGMQNANMNTQYVMGAVNDKYNEITRDIQAVAIQNQQLLANQNECCCSTKMLIAETAANQRYESAMQNNAIMQAIQADGNMTRAMIQQDKIDTLNQKVQALEMQNAMAGVIRYPMSTAYNAGYNPFCNCGNGCMMG